MNTYKSETSSISNRTKPGQNRKPKTKLIFTVSTSSLRRREYARGTRRLELTHRPTVWILGAGASRNYSETRRVQKTYRGLLPPLQTDFFQMASRVVAAARLRVPEHAESPLSQLLYELRMFYPSSHWESSKHFWDGNPHLLLAKDSPNLEDIFTLLDLFLESGYTRLGVKAHSITGGKFFHHASVTKGIMLDELARDRFVALLIATLATSMGAPVCELHGRLTRLIKRGDTVISYNYDTLIDDALAAAGKLAPSGYEVGFLAGLAQEWQTPADGARLAHGWRTLTDDPSPVRLLKLHGSLNWIVCPSCQALFYDGGVEGEPLMQTLSKFLEWRLEEIGSNKAAHLADWIRLIDPLSEVECRRCTSPLKRVIIPPVLNKAFAKQQFLVPWYEAAKVMKRSCDVVVLGYSLPPTDYHSRLLFSLADDPKGVIVINPDPLVAKRVQVGFKLRKEPTVMTLERFLEEYKG